jgi:CRISPR type IV-associated protein Csf3
MYKISFKMKTPICFIDKPMFDAIVAYCYAREVLGKHFKQALHLRNAELLDFSKMPLKMYNDKYFIATWMFWDKEIEYSGSWKKRWASQHDSIADFQGKKRKVRVAAGRFKSYDVPLPLHNIPEVWFYFDSDDVARVRYLIEKWLFGIGKKTSQGYGEYDSYCIEKDNYDFARNLDRPIPISKNEAIKLMSKQNRLKVKYTGYKPPYWLPDNHGWCIVK